jgi:hypothetical protein
MLDPGPFYSWPEAVTAQKPQNEAQIPILKYLEHFKAFGNV